MKKIFSMLLVLIGLIAFTACGNRDFKYELLFGNSEDSKSTLVCYDMTGDGKEEEIKVSITDDDNLLISSMDKEISFGFGEVYYLYKIYGIDLDTKDGYRELAVITDEVSSDVFLRVIRLNEDGFYALEFQNGEYVSDEAYIGYDAEIEILEKNKIKTSERGSFGMWSVEAEYTFDGEKFVKEERDVRDVVRSSYAYYEDEKVAEEMGEDLINYGMISDKAEIDLLKEGLVLAHSDFNGKDVNCPHGESVKLLKGEIFKITKESTDGFLYIEKKGGKSGWVYFGDFTDNRNDVSPLAFYMAD